MVGYNQDAVEDKTVEKNDCTVIIEEESDENRVAVNNNVVEGDEDFYDDDGKPKRTGTIWTSSAHIVTAVIGSGVLSLAWCLAQLGWIAGPIIILLFSTVTYYSSCLLADCYRSPDPVTGKRHYSYNQVVNANLGKKMQMICGFTQYLNIVGIAIGYVITASLSMVAIHKLNCLQKSHGNEASCNVSDNIFMISFGIVQIILSQIPNIHKLSWLSTVAALMSFSYATIGVGLSLSRVISGNIGKTSLVGTPIVPGFSGSQKMWRTFKAVGDIAFSYSFSLILIEIQDTMKAPAENKKMKKANLISILTTTMFYMACGCAGYAAFGNDAPGNLLIGFGVNEPHWVVNFANACIVVHIVGAYQVFSQPLFAAVETKCAKKFPTSKFITHEYPIKFVGFKFNMFRLVWRTLFVVVTTVFGMAMPFFNDILALLGAIGYWPLTIFFPIQMYISQKKIKAFTSKWLGLQFLNIGCMIVAIAAAGGAIHGVVRALQVYKPFTSRS